MVQITSDSMHRFPALPDPLPRNGAWSTYTTADGLASLRVDTMTQDAAGDLWFGTTASGVSRFDGRSWHTYTMADGLAGNQVTAALATSSGDVWLGTWDGGLCLWDGQGFGPATGTEPARAQVAALSEDSQGRIWYAGRQTLRYRDGLGVHDLQAIGQDACPAGIDNCWGICTDAAGRVYSGTDLGVLVYDGQCLRLEFCEDRPGSNIPMPICGDGHGGVWICGKTWIYHSDGAHVQRLAPYQGADQYASVDHRSASVDADGRLWIATADGVCYLDAGGLGQFTVEDGLEYRTCTRVTADTEGRIWVATWGGGVSCYDPQRVQSCSPPPASREGCCSHSLAHCSGTVWVGGAGPEHEASIAYWDGASCHPLAAAKGRCGGRCSAIACGSSGEVYFGTDSGLLRWDDVDLSRVDLPGAGQETVVTALCSAPQGGVYVGLAEKPPGTRVHICRLDGEAIQPLLTADMDPDFSVVSCLAIAADGALWAGVSNQYGYNAHSGLVRIGADTRWFTAEDGLVDGRVRDLLSDVDGRLWIAHLGGLSWYDGECFHNLSTRDGLVNNSVLGLCQDAAGRVWCATEAGLCATDGYVHPTIRVPGVGPVRAATVDDAGQVWCTATDGGAIRYRPGVRPPGIEITRVVADTTHEPQELVEMPVTTQQVRFEYAGIAPLTLRGWLRFRYRLRGVEQEWRPTTTDTAAIYTQLDVGEYTFEAQSIDPDLNYSDVARVQLQVVADPQVVALQAALKEGLNGQQLVGESQSVGSLREQIGATASADLPVLILGETGTGKGVAARAVHQVSKSSDGPFIQISCGAIPSGLVESELFGHERGSFTSAHVRRIGKVELAAGGTLFLDEIGDLPPEGQVKLLRLLEEGVYERVGGNQSMEAHVRVIAATNRDLQQMMDAGDFRADLYYRLQGFKLTVPTLRERLEDVPLLAAYFADAIATHISLDCPELSLEALAALTAYHWPGNVRELEHVIQRAVVVCKDGSIGLHDLGLDEARSPAAELGTGLSLEEVERRYIQQVLEQTGWVVEGPGGAAAILRLKPSTLRNRMARLGIRRQDTLS
jgi:DNA-binding NtrC family response regulator/ligand-binding sensor domain-containing protein